MALGDGKAAEAAIRARNEPFYRVRRVGAAYVRARREGDVTAGRAPA